MVLTLPAPDADEVRVGSTATAIPTPTRFAIPPWSIGGPPGWVVVPARVVPEGRTNGDALATGRRGERVWIPLAQHSTPRLISPGDLEAWYHPGGNGEKFPSQ